MELLDRKNWWIVLILNILTLGLFTLYIGYKLKVYDKNAWYQKWYYWALGILFVIPFLIMFLIFEIQTAVSVSKKLNLYGMNIYGLPYTWILCVIIPVLGWILFILMYIYVNLFYVFKLKEGYGLKD